MFWMKKVIGLLSAGEQWHSEKEDGTRRVTSRRQMSRRKMILKENNSLPCWWHWALSLWGQGQGSSSHGGPPYRGHPSLQNIIVWEERRCFENLCCPTRSRSETWSCSAYRHPNPNIQKGKGGHNKFVTNICCLPFNFFQKKLLFLHFMKYLGRDRTVFMWYLGWDETVFMCYLSRVGPVFMYILGKRI